MLMKGVMTEEGQYHMTETLVTHKSLKGNYLNIVKKKNDIQLSI